MSELKIGDTVVSLIDHEFTLNAVTYNSLIKGEKYKVVDLHPNAEFQIELEPLESPSVFICAKPEELELVERGAA